MTDTILRQVDDLKLTDGQKVSARELEKIFDICGVDLSALQRAELLTTLDNGKCFNRQRLQKWVSKNCNYFGKSLTVRYDSP